MIELFDNVNNFSYNSLQASVTHSFSKQYSLFASYVWSKAFDTSDVSSTSGNASLTLADEDDPQMDYGLSSTHIGQVFKASFLDTLPAVKHFGIVGREVLSGWQINGIVLLESGEPFNVTSNVDTNFDGNATDRPDTIGNPSFGGGRSRTEKIAKYFNTAAFAVPQAGELYGNTPRNSLIGPGYVDADLAGAKEFPIRENVDLKFRGEVFNAFNNVNLNNPGSTRGTVQFGQISGSGSPRIAQFARRLEF